MIIKGAGDPKFGNLDLFGKFVVSGPAVVRHAQLWTGLGCTRWTAQWNWIQLSGNRSMLSSANITG